MQLIQREFSRKNLTITSKENASAIHTQLK
jgi:hypothetical protein